MSANIDVSSIKLYNDYIDIVIMLMLLIPLVAVFFILTDYINSRRVYQISVSQHKDFPFNNDITKLSDRMGGFDQNCRDNVRWVYSHKYLDPMYGSCNLTTVEDCYRWLMCMRPGICPQPLD